jgi:hypothetical protein
MKDILFNRNGLGVAYNVTLPSQSLSCFVPVAPPTITGFSGSVVHALPGQDVELNCTATGIPEPSIRWYRGNSSADTQFRGELRIFFLDFILFLFLLFFFNLAAWHSSLTSCTWLDNVFTCIIQLQRNDAQFQHRRDNKAPLTVHRGIYTLYQAMFIYRLITPI